MYRFCYRYSAQILVPSLLSVGITLLLSLLLFPKLMFVEFNKVSSSMAPSIFRSTCNIH